MVGKTKMGIEKGKRNHDIDTTCGHLRSPAYVQRQVGVRSITILIIVISFF
jgi:hypothetical protein